MRRLLKRQSIAVVSFILALACLPTAGAQTTRWFRCVFVGNPDPPCTLPPNDNCAPCPGEYGLYCGTGIFCLTTRWMYRSIPTGDCAPSAVSSSCTVATKPCIEKMDCIAIFDVEEMLYVCVWSGFWVPHVSRSAC